MTARYGSLQATSRDAALSILARAATTVSGPVTEKPGGYSPLQNSDTYHALEYPRVGAALPERTGDWADALAARNITAAKVPTRNELPMAAPSSHHVEAIPRPRLRPAR